MRLIDADRIEYEQNEDYKDDYTGKTYRYSYVRKENIDKMPTIKAELVKNGRWIMIEKDKLVPTGKIAVSEGYILHKTSFDKPFTLQSANIIKIKEHRTVKIPYCSICGNYGDDEYDKTPYCPSCGARMDGEENEQEKED